MAEIKTNKRPLVFLGVGIINTLVDFGFYTFLTSFVSNFKNGRHIQLAGLISGTFAMFFALILHSLITWRGSHINHKTVLKFFAFTGFGMWVIRPQLLGLFIHLRGLYHWVDKLLDKIGLHFTYNFVANTGAFGFMILILLVYNYLVYERFVFKSKPTHTELKSR